MECLTLFKKIPREFTLDIQHSNGILFLIKKKKKTNINSTLRDSNFLTFAVEFLPQPLPELLRVLLVVVPSVSSVHRSPVVLRERGEALGDSWFEGLQRADYKVCDDARLLECLFSVLAVRWLDLELAVQEAQRRVRDVHPPFESLQHRSYLLLIAISTRFLAKMHNIVRYRETRQSTNTVSDRETFAIGKMALIIQRRGRKT